MFVIFRKVDMSLHLTWVDKSFNRQPLSLRNWHQPEKGDAFEIYERKNA